MTAFTELDDPYAMYERLRTSDPVHRVSCTDFYLVSTWDLVMEAVNRPADFSSHLTAALVQRPNGKATVFDLDGAGQAIHVLATGDDPTHMAQRKLVLPTLVAKRIRALEPAIEAMAAELITDGMHDNRIEWMSAVGDRLPMTIVARLIGLPEQDVPQLVEWGYASTELLGGVTAEDRLGAVVTAAAALADYLRSKLELAGASPTDTLLGDLARAHFAGDLDSTVAVLMLVQLVGAGGESTAGLIGNAVRMLALDTALQQRIRVDRDLLASFLEEALRLESPFRGHHRHVVADTTLGGVRLPAGSHLLLLWGAANRDPRAFDDPDQIRLDRPNLRAHLAFGKGAHFCVGAALARLEARISLSALLDATSEFALAPTPDAAQWLPSIFVRRHLKLDLVTVATPDHT
ncbi:cytochrome P450 [Antrihabitans cavernicola]|uniref:Cytochrome P450 n=1 Tax=Antrihabitans cavernicola TaxID=2495913 RepID=A0A5A7S6T2_9NOCA|nr:cytochrome P450 [Spelaeibacter cavernicola]KAA0018985.1 cytochrome P450 [Spelaeibacter cavernicola]